MEKLAVLTKILDIAPIEGADKIERATVLGWQVVSQKGLHKIGDMVIMVFPDSLVPKRFLDSSYIGEEKVRLKTVKMRGQYSAGLILPIRELTNDENLVGWSEGDEVSVHLGIEKWVAPAGSAIAGDQAGGFPTRIISKTDEYNFRSEPRALAELSEDRFQDQVFVSTLKCDGSSGTFIYKEGVFHVCSRNFELKETAGNALWQVAKKYKLKEALSADGNEYAIQGEVCGPGVQGNPMKLSEISFFAFLLKDVKTHQWIDYDSMLLFCSKHGIPVAPELHRFHSSNFPSLEMLQEWANNAKYDNGRANAEGLVVRSVQPIRSEALQKGWWSLKVMNQPYDMKKG